MVTKDITQLSIIELEALGYQTLKEIEIHKLNLMTIENEIALRRKEPVIESSTDVDAPK